MAEIILKALLDDQTSIKSIIEWLSSDVDELKLINVEKANCTQGEFVTYVLGLLRQSFLSAHPLPTIPSQKNLKQNTGGGTHQSQEKSNKTVNVLTPSQLKVHRTPPLNQGTPEVRKDVKVALCHTLSPQETNASHPEKQGSPFKSIESQSPIHRTPLRVSSFNDSQCVTPIQKKHRSFEHDFRHSNSDTVPISPSASRSKNANRSRTLADFMRESPNQRKRFSHGHPKADKIATSTPSHDSEKDEPANSPSPGWRNNKQQRRIKPTKVLCFDNESLTKNSKHFAASEFARDDTFGVVARPQVVQSFETQSNLNEFQGSLSFAEERSLLKDECLKLQNSSNQSTPPNVASLASLTSTPAKPPVVKEVADPSKVTFKEHLVVLCDLYSNMIDANLISNLTRELHFVLSLLVMQKISSEKEGPILTDISVTPKGKIQQLKVKVVPEEKTEEESFINISTDSNADVIPSENSYANCSQGEKNAQNLDRSHVQTESATEDSNTVTPNQSHCASPMLTPKKEIFEDGKSNSMHLDTIHNCVFFATNVLWRQRQLLGNLDRVTMKLLLDNERVSRFMPELASAIEEMYNNASPRTTVGQNLTATSLVLNFSTSENVAFHSERDNSTNFESNNAFRSFRKQRDAFYNIFQFWEARHLDPSWDFYSALKPRIRALLDMCSDSTNYMHLARLFRMQLVAAVMGGKISSDELDSSFLECLRGVDPEKLNRLRERLVTPCTSDDPRPTPQFPGQQEFFREFIMAVDNISFIEHLKDNLVSHLLELDQTDFWASDVEESDLEVNEETRLAFVTCVTTMQLLAKFLGFIVFLPYQKRTDVSERIIESELAIRCKVGPPLNVMALVNEAWSNRRLVVTLPWVVQYLGMMDTGAVELPFYRNTISLLLKLYAGLACSGGKTCPFAPEDMAPKTVMLLRFVLGWLFELPCLRDGFLFVWKRARSEEILQGDPDNNLIVRRSAIRENTSCVNWNSSLGGPPLSSADSLDLVDTAVLYGVCPYLSGLRFLLSTVQEANSNAGGSVRHIRPVSAPALQPMEPVKTDKLELQLEESFFHGLPESVQKTVEFVVERVTSACIKQICNTLIPSLKKHWMNEFKTVIAEELKNKKPDDVKEKLTEQKDLVVKHVMAEMRTKCNEDVERICNERCRAALPALLSQVSFPPCVCEMCVLISIRLSTERVIAWFRTHTTFKTYAAELEEELAKALKVKPPEDPADVVEKTSHLAANPDCEHDNTAPAPTDTLIRLRDLICDILDMHGEGVTQEAVANMIKDLERIATARADVTIAAKGCFAALLRDLSVALVCHCPEIVTDDFIKDVIALWRNEDLLPAGKSLARIICPRNLLLLGHSSKPAQMVWNRLAQLVGATLCEELVTADDVELQCLTILHQVWPQALLLNFSTCVSEIVRVYRKKATNVDSEKFVYLLNWLAEITKNMEDFSD